MASPSPKRRKTRQSASAPGSAVGTPSRSQSARASYLSPTKASLARFNPSLLPSTQSSPSAAARNSAAIAADARQSRGELALDYVLGKTAEFPEAAQGHQEQLPNQSEPNDDDANAEVATPVTATEGTQDIPMLELPRGSNSAEELLEDDDDLPETPQTEGENSRPEYQDSPPRGILFSTPRRRKQKTLLKSPLGDQSIEIPREAEPEKGLASPKEPQIEDLAARSQRKALEARLTERDALSRELNALEEEVQNFEKHILLDQTTARDAEYDDFDGLLTLINGSSLDFKLETSAQPSISTLLTSFLPFSVPVPEVSTEDVAEAAVPSHAPLPDTLPLLSQFTPFAITSNISAPSKPSNPASSITQLHTITLDGPSSLLKCNLDLTIASDPADPRHPTVSSLQVQQLPWWAEREVGAWVRERERECDVAAIGYGLGRYWEVSFRRAQCWTKCCRVFGHLIPGVQESVRIVGLDDAEEVLYDDGKSVKKPPQTRGKKKARGSRKRADVEMEDGNTGIEEGTLIPGTGIPRSEIHRHLGRDCLTFKSRDVLLRVSWRLQFDWTGEIESSVSARAAFPSIWREADERSSLKKLPATFDRLVKRVGVFEAVKIMVGLVFKEDDEIMS